MLTFSAFQNCSLNVVIPWWFYIKYGVGLDLGLVVASLISCSSSALVSSWAQQDEFYGLRELSSLQDQSEHYWLVTSLLPTSQFRSIIESYKLPDYELMSQPKKNWRVFALFPCCSDHHLLLLILIPVSIRSLADPKACNCFYARAEISQTCMAVICAYQQQENLWDVTADHRSW